MSKQNKEFITRGTGKDRDSILAAWFRQHKEEVAIKLMPSVDPDRMRSMWKEANGFSTPNYTKSEDKPKRKRVQKKKED